MNKKLVSLFWGLVLVVAGGVGLAQTLGYLRDGGDPLLWAAVFAGISLISFIFYFLSGIQNWPMLFPAAIFAALAGLLFMASRGFESSAVAAPLFAGIGLPFVVAYILDRAKNWWAVIPAGVMAFLTLTLLFVERTGGEIVGASLFFCLAAAFGLVYLSRRVFWAALVAYIMFVLGFMPLMAMGQRPEFAGVVMLFGIAIPFFYVYIRSPQERWWAIIPAGILSTSGLLTAAVLFAGSPVSDTVDRLASGIMLIGIAVTFGIVWLRNHKRWAAFFAVLAGALGFLEVFLGNLQQFWPVAIILAGAFMLFNGLRPREA